MCNEGRERQREWGGGEREKVRNKKASCFSALGLAGAASFFPFVFVPIWCGCLWHCLHFGSVMTVFVVVLFNFSVAIHIFKLHFQMHRIRGILFVVVVLVRGTSAKRYNDMIAYINILLWFFFSFFVIPPFYFVRFIFVG